MSSKDFTLSEIAAYLHVTPQQIQKLIAKEDLPVRRVGGELRFPESEIHHWLEKKIGISNDLELSGVENILDRAREADEYDPTIQELLHAAAIAVPLTSRTRNSVVRDMCQLAAETGMLWDKAAMVEAVMAREDLHPTALENGVALLHPRRPQTSILAQSFISIGVSPQPIPFGNSAGHLTDVFFLLCSYSDKEHLKILARVSRIISDEEWLAELRLCEDSKSVIEHLSSHELVDLPE